MNIIRFLLVRRTNRFEGNTFTKDLSDRLLHLIPSGAHVPKLARLNVQFVSPRHLKSNRKKIKLMFMLFFCEVKITLIIYNP